MSGPVAQFSVYEGGRSVVSGEPPRREIQELWFTLARHPWSSLVLVPTDVGMSVADFATELAEVGTMLRENPVTAIVARTLNYESARRLSDVHGLIAEGASRRLPDVIEVEAKITLAPSVEEDRAEPPARVARSLSPYGQVIIAIRLLVEEPLGIAVAQAADAVVLCVEMGTSRLASARRTLELVGPERVLGTFLIHGQ